MFHVTYEYDGDLEFVAVSIEAAKKYIEGLWGIELVVEYSNPKEAPQINFDGNSEVAILKVKDNPESNGFMQYNDFVVYEIKVVS